MTAPLPPSDTEAALDWAVRTSDPAFRDWEGFAAWVGGDPARNLAYDRAMAAVADAAEAWPRDAAAREPAPVPNVVPLAGRRVRGWAWGAGIAALAAGVAGVLLLDRSADMASHVIEAPAGRPQVIAFADGSRIELAGGGRLRLDPAHPRHAELEQGRAYFTVRHDDAASFSVTAGPHRIVDLGTAFEVGRTGTATTVAVTEGRVMVNPDQAALALAPGDTASLRNDAVVAVSRVPPETIAQWRLSRMTYRDAPLSRVAADLSAALGRPVVVRGAVAARRFTGTIVPATLAARPDELAALLDVRVRAGDGGWELTAR